MDREDLKNRNFEDEFVFSTSRSSGPGGQNVNKLSTKVELRFNVLNTVLFSQDEKAILYEKLSKKINKDGELILVSQKERSQFQNRIQVIEKFYVLVIKTLEPRAKRIPTRPSTTSVSKRLSEKRNRGYIKQLRKDAGGVSGEN